MSIKSISHNELQTIVGGDGHNIVTLVKGNGQIELGQNAFGLGNASAHVTQTHTIANINFPGVDDEELDVFSAGAQGIYNDRAIPR